jgi:hypothetical protein
VPAQQSRQGALTYRVFVAVPDTLLLAVPIRARPSQRAVRLIEGFYNAFGARDVIGLRGLEPDLARGER